MFFHNITIIGRFLPRLKPGVSALLTYEREVRYRQRQDMRIAAKEVRRFYITARTILSLPNPSDNGSGTCMGKTFRLTG